MSENIKSGFRVVGPNTSDLRESTWYFPTLKEARHFCEHIALEVDAEYDIFQFIGTVRQEPAPKRPIQWIAAKKTK